MSIQTLPTRKIGGTDVTAIGYGAMGLGGAFYGAAPSDEERLAFLDSLYERGCTNWDTAHMYLTSEEIIGKWFAKTGKRKEIFLATKFGVTVNETGVVIRGDPEFVREQFETSCHRLQTDYIDLFYIHRPDARIPIEITVRAMVELVKAGKVKHLGISECSAATLRRAHAIHPIAALQTEYSPFTLEAEDPSINLIPTARELGVTIVAYSPLGRGLLSGQYKGPEDFAEGDLRRSGGVPRYSKENFPRILALADGLKKIGEKHGATAGQIALAWLLAQGEDVIPIPGTRSLTYLDENLGAAKIELSEEEVREVRRVAAEADATSIGGRVAPEYEEFNYIDTPELEE